MKISISVLIYQFAGDSFQLIHDFALFLPEPNGSAL